MRRAVLALPIALPLALLAGCGASSPPPLFGGFEPVEGTAIVFPPATCNNIALGTISVSGLAVVLGDFTGTCDFVTAAQFCDRKASATLLVTLAVSGVTGGGTAPAFGPGSYPYLAQPPTSASFAAGIGSAARTDATCSALPGAATDMSGGRVVVTSVTADRATGTLDLRFDDGSAYDRPFDLALCPPPTDICALIELGACTSHACLP